MDFPISRSCLSDDFREFVRRGRCGNTNRSSAIRERRQRAFPHHVVQRGVVAVEDCLAGVGVEGQGKAGLVESSVVEERAVLPETIIVRRVVHRRLVVSEEDDQAGGKGVGKCATTGGVGVGSKHQPAVGETT